MPASGDRTVASSRREILALGVGAFVVATVPFAWRSRQRLVRRTLPVMGTLADVAVVHSDERLAQRAIDAALEQLRFVDRTMTRYSTSSDVGRSNARAAHEAVPVRVETAAVLEEALCWARATDGVFDPCLGRAVELWDVTRRDAPPGDADVRRFAGRRLFESLQLEGRATAPSVRFLDSDVALDLGGIAKGYGVDLASDALRAHGVEQALVNVGGDLYALGSSTDGDPWKVGVRSPDDPTQLSRVLEIRDAAVATSGDYEQFFRHGERRYHHLLEAATGEPRVTDAHSLTIVADSCMRADAAATALFGAERGSAREVLEVAAPGAWIA